MGDKIASVEDLRESFVYRYETGDLLWKQRPTRASVVVGGVAGRIDRKSGYRIVMFRKKNYRCHRIAWALVHGRWPEKQIDHINGMRSDNRLSNLREVDRFENQQNRNALSANLGHSLASDGKYRASIWVRNKRIYLGRFKTKKDASLAYLSAKRRLHTTQNDAFLAKAIAALSTIGDLPPDPTEGG